MHVPSTSHATVTVLDFDAARASATRRRALGYSRELDTPSVRHHLLKARPWHGNAVAGHHA